MAPEAARLAFGAALVGACGAVVPATASESSQLVYQTAYLQFDDVTTLLAGRAAAASACRRGMLAGQAPIYAQ